MRVLLYDSVAVKEKYDITYDLREENYNRAIRSGTDEIDDDELVMKKNKQS